MKSTVKTTEKGAGKPSRQPDLLADETGAIFLEFLIVLFPFMFILFGTIQIGLIATASFYTNYANFMALRTAAVRWELKENNIESSSNFNLRCKLAAMAAIQPIEHYWYKHPLDAGAQLDVANRVTVTIDAVSGNNFSGPSGTNQANRPKFIKGHTEYQYYLIVPFANFVFGAFDQNKNISDTNSKRVMVNFRTFVPPSKPYPTLTLRSSDDLKTISGTSLPHPHEMVVQRRWLY